MLVLPSPIFFLASFLPPPSSLSFLAVSPSSLNRSSPLLELSETQIHILWDEKQLGCHTPQSLLRTVWFNNTMFFGWRASDEHHRVKYGDIKIKCEDGPEGREYVEWIIERGSKTRTGKHEFVLDRRFNPKMFATDGPRCPAKIFKEYLARRPPEMASADSPLYLASIAKPSSHIWFKRQPLGKNLLGSFMKSMSEAAGLSRKHTRVCTNSEHTNHSVRRTMISTLRKENVEPFKHHCTSWSEKLEVFGQLFRYVHQAAKGHVLKTQLLRRGWKTS